MERCTEPDRLGLQWEVIDPVTLRRRDIVDAPLALTRFPTPIARRGYL